MDRRTLLSLIMVGHILSGPGALFSCSCAMASCTSSSIGLFSASSSLRDNYPKIVWQCNRICTVEV